MLSTSDDGRKETDYCSRHSEQDSYPSCEFGVNESLITASDIASYNDVSRLSENHDFMLNRELVVNESPIDASVVANNDEVSCFSESSSANS
jgi:hypothetical protein